MTERRADPVPFTVIGGYLGAGKTTLLNRLLAQPSGRRFGVVVNDIGAVDIDAALVESTEGETVTLSNGCVCCSLADGFQVALASLLDRDIDHVLVEVSGVGDPWKVGQWGRTPGFELNAVIVLADAETIAERAADRRVGQTVLSQLTGADIVMITKSDLVADAGASARVWVTDRIAAPCVVMGDGADPVDLIDVVHRRGQTAGTTHAEHLVRVWDGPAEQTRGWWGQWLEAAPDGVVRAKGFVPSPDGTLQVQLVGRRVEVTRWKGAPVPAAIVAIALPGTDDRSLDRWFSPPD